MRELLEEVKLNSQNINEQEATPEQRRAIQLYPTSRSARQRVRETGQLPERDPQRQETLSKSGELLSNFIPAAGVAGAAANAIRTARAGRAAASTASNAPAALPKPATGAATSTSGNASTGTAVAQRPSTAPAAPSTSVTPSAGASFSPGMRTVGSSSTAGPNYTPIGNVGAFKANRPSSITPGGVAAGLGLAAAAGGAAYMASRSGDDSKAEAKPTEKPAERPAERPAGTSGATMPGGTAQAAGFGLSGARSTAGSVVSTAPAPKPAAPRPAARPAAPSPKPTAPAPDPNATSRAMFQRASDKGDDATSADFFAADAQRTRELRSQRTNEGTTMKSPMIEAFLKLQEKNSYNLFAEAKKKRLDPVGKEDDDIDNDGDSDKTDSYLRNRRAAIGKAIKEASDDEVNAIIRGVPGQKNKERESSSKDDINSAKASKPERKDNDSEKPAKSSSAPSIKPGDQTMVGQDDDRPEPAKKPVIKPTDQTMVGQDDDKPEPAKKPATPERSQAFRDLTRKHDEDPEFRYTELELDQMRDQIKKLPKDEQTAFIVRQLTPRPSVVKKYGMGRKVDESREDRRSAHPDFAAPGDPRAPKYKDEIEYKKDNETKFPDHPMPPRRPKNLRNESRINEQGVEVISANDPRTKNYAIPKSDVGTFPAPQSDRDNEKKEKYTNRAPSERPYGDLQGAKKAMAKEEISFSRAELEHFASILEMSVAPTPDDYSGSNNGPSKRDLSDETIVETKKKDPSQLQKRGRKAGVKVGSYKMKGMDDVEDEEHKAEPKNLVAQNPRTYNKEGRNLVDLEHPSKPGVKRTVPAKEYNSFRSSYLNAEKPEHKTRMHDDYVKRVFN